MVEDLTQSADLEVLLCCEALGLSRASFYAWKSRTPSTRAIEDELLLARIRLIHEKTDQTYGSPRMTKELRAEGNLCGNKYKIDTASISGTFITSTEDELLISLASDYMADAK